MNVKSIGKLIGCISAYLLLPTSCGTDSMIEQDIENPSGSGEEVTVSFNLQAEGKTTAASGGRAISDGTQTDMLIYAVYEEDYTPLRQYGLDLVDKDGQPTEWWGEEANRPDFAGEKRDGQTIMKVDGVFDNGGTQKITLRLMRNKTYRIAFWAQSSKTAAYDTENLRQVEVKYADALNNDELRDAFCKVETFSVTAENQNISVILTRPLAQINVGTTGADYNNTLTGTNVTPHYNYAYSTITLDGVAKYIDVVADKVLAEGDKLIDGTVLTAATATTTATYSWNKFAAFLNMDELPSTVDGLIGPATGEEFLKVDLNADGTLLDYKKTYPTLNADKDYLTETFKYLSMCYALVPASKTAVPDYDSDGNPVVDPYNSAVLNKVSFQFSAVADGSASNSKTVELTSVPVHRNWRTNILGGLYYGKPTGGPNDPDDPDDPTPPTDPDPSTVFAKSTMVVNIMPGINGDYNTGNGGSTWTQKANQ